MSFPKTRPGNPDRGWNDPPMFNYTPGVQPPTPKRTLNKRVAFPASAPPLPGHAVLSPVAGPPVLNPVLSGTVLTQPEKTQPLPIPIGLRDTPLGNQAPPISPVQILPPSTDASAPQAVPLLVPGMVPTTPPMCTEPAFSQIGIADERLDDLCSRLSLNDRGGVLQCNLDRFNAELDKYKSILTLKVCDDIKRKLELIKDKWEKGSFSEIVQVRITQLAEALSKEDTDKANQLHLALMVDHISEVNQWMMGVKRLIQQQQLAKSEKELIANKSDASDEIQDKTNDKGDNCDRLVDESDENVRKEFDEDKKEVVNDSVKTDLESEEVLREETDTQDEGVVDALSDDVKDSLAGGDSATQNDGSGDS